MLDDNEKEDLRYRERLFRALHLHIFMDLLHSIQREIFETVDPKYREWIYGKNNVKEMLLSLQSRVAGFRISAIGIYRVTTSAFLFSPTICI
jgi:hypothetical protein